MQIERLKIADIRPYEKNAKVHTPEQIDQIIKSIEQFGMNDPIAIWSDKNIVVEGHGRLLALIKMGVDEVDCIRLDHLTDEERKAYTLAHNQLTLNTGFDELILKDELMDIKEFDMSEFGFEMDYNEPKEAEDDNYEIDNVLNEKEPIAKMGDIYQLGTHRIMCGDSTNHNDVEALMNGDAADLLITDPPYNVDYQGGTKEKLKIENDNMSSEKFYDFLLDAFQNANDVMKDGAGFYVWYAFKNAVEFRNALKDAGLQTRQELIWIKNALVLGRGDYQWIHEPCLYGWKEGAVHYFIDCRSNTTAFEDELDLEKMKKEDMKKLLDEIYSQVPTTIIREHKPLKNAEHPTMKPVKLIGKLINNSSKPGDIIVDLFAGSGTTIIASEQLGRTCYSMEYDPRYVDVIVNRWETLTGKKAEKIK